MELEALNVQVETTSMGSQYVGLRETTVVLVYSYCPGISPNLASVPDNSAPVWTIYLTATLSLREKVKKIREELTGQNIGQCPWRMRGGGVKASYRDKKAQSEE